MSCAQHPTTHGLYGEWDIRKGLKIFTLLNNVTVVADNCSNPETVAGPIRTLGGVVLARVVDCRGFAWTEVCEDYGLFVGECLRALNIPAAVLDRWLRRVARRHGVCAGWEMYDVCLEEEIGKAKEDILRLQRAAKPWLLPYADVSPSAAFQQVEVGALSPEPAALMAFDGVQLVPINDVKSPLD